jgi:hypothetical protein
VSAWIVSKTHIDLLVTAGLHFAGHRDRLRWYYGNPTRSGELDPSTAHIVGQMLWAENLASVAGRYPADVSGQRPGPNDFEDEQVLTYRFARVPGALDRAAVLKALHCYEYQSCEHDGWQSSAAHAFCRALERSIVTSLPGYAAAPWGFDDPHYFTGQPEGVGA